MIWLTWRQLRTQAIWVSGGLAVFAAVLLATGLDMAHLHHTYGDRFLQFAGGTDSNVYLLAQLLTRVLPAIIGVFWGAPLVARELESGTHRLVWNQSVTRTRWLAAKLGLVGLVALTATALLTLAVNWWCAPIDQAVAQGYGTAGYAQRLSPTFFDSRGVVPVAWAAVAFAIGVAVGMGLRRTVLAMATSLAVFAVVQGIVTVIRPLLASPSTVTVPISADNFMGLRNGALSVDIHQHGAWVTGGRTLDAAGHSVSVPPAFTNCMQSGGDPQVCGGALGKLGYRQETTFHPASHFWPLQWQESGLLLALALGIVGLCFWWIRRERA